MSNNSGAVYFLRASRLLTVLALGLVSGPSAVAQTNDEVNAAIQFNFSSPGARSLALGGAFIGLADDATAAYANPAGLKVLSKPEFSVEGRRWSYTHIFTDSGDLTSGFDRVMSNESENEVTGISFLSYVYPRKRLTVALYRHELANFEADFDAGFDEPLSFEDNILKPVQTALDLMVVNTGISFSVKLSEALSLGAGLVHSDFKIGSLTKRLNPLTGVIADEQTQIGDDTELGWSMGFLWDIGERSSLGGVFRKGVNFGFSATNDDKEAAGDGPTFPAVFNLPDSYGIGLALKPVEKLTMTIDYVRVEYSDLVDGFIDLFGVTDIDEYRLDDGDEIRLGLEYIFLPGGKPLAVRFGAWHDPDHSIRYEGRDVFDRALFRGGDDEIHYSFGLGRSFGQRFQLDAAIDLSDRVDTTSLSAIFRF